MSRNWFAGWRGFVVAAGLAALALFFVYFFLEIRTPFLPCIAAVLMTGWLAGPRPALLCAFIAVSATSYSNFTVVPALSASEAWSFATRELIFVAVCALAVLIAQAQRKAEASAHSQKDLLAFTLANSAYGVIAADEQGRIVLMNPRAHRLTGFGDEALGRPAGEIFRVAELHTFKELENPIQRALREGVPARLADPALLLSKDGRRYVIEDSASTFSTPYTAPRHVVLIFRDVTEQRSIEAELRNNAERLRMALQAGGLSTWEWNIVTGELECDELPHLLPAGSKGTIEEYMAGIHSEDQAATQHALEKSLEEQKEFVWEYRFVLPNGETVWRSSLAQPFYNESGAAVKMLGITRDITEQKLVDQIVREGQAQFRSVAENASDGFLTIDERSKIVYANGATAMLFGYTRAELIGHPVTTLIPARLHERHLGAFKRYQETGTRTLDWRQMEFPAQRKDGVEIPVEVSISEMQVGHRRLFSAIVRDISERRRAQQEVAAASERERLARERLELAQRAAHIGTYERSIKTGQMTLTPELEVLLGLEPGQFSGRFEDWLKFMSPLDAERVSKSIESATRTGADYDIEYRITRADGGTRWLASSGKILFDTAGNPDRSIGVCSDITQRKTLEAERERILEREMAARAEAERASQLKDEFLATVSHELRTPLTSILGWSKLLLADSLDPEALRRGMESIDRNARAQAQLVEDLLDVSRIITGRLRVNLAPLDFADVIRDAVESIRPTALAKKLELEVHLEPARVSGDLDRLQQVAFNILFNAVKFSFRGGRIEVRLELRGHRAHLSVRDNGKGINPAFLPNLFQRFTQEDMGSTRRHGGMGLGLAITRHLVELHGGAVRAESEGEGKGATVIVELPQLRTGESGLFNRTETRTDGRPSSANIPKFFANLDGAQVLCVEDDADTRTMIAAALRLAGIKVLEAESAEHAFELFTRERPQAILSDISLPGEDGVALIRKIRALSESAGGSTPAVALTAHSRSEDSARLLASGFQKFLRKPVNPADVLEALSAVLPARLAATANS